MPAVLFFVEYLDAVKALPLGVIACTATTTPGQYHNVLTNDMIGQNYLQRWCKQVSEGDARLIDPELFRYTLDAAMKGMR